jgi:F0F1-type ATP synthase assembly protein I
MRRFPRTLRLLGLGWYIAFCLVLGTFCGVWLDQQLNVAPLFLLVGLAIGLVAGFVGVYRMVERAVEE